MLKKNTKNNNGFTLIELMVVIAIIGLLSSIVLAALKDARDKATATKFKSEVRQLVNALELYKNDTGTYPYDEGYLGNYHSVIINNANTESSSPTNGQLLSTVLSGKYLNTLPKVPTNSYNQTQASWTYYANNSTNFPKIRCVGDVNVPKYVLLFSGQNPTTSGIFSELPNSESQPYSGSSWYLYGVQCFSLK